MTENEALTQRLEQIAALAGRRVRIESSERELEAERARWLDMVHEKAARADQLQLRLAEAHEEIAALKAQAAALKARIAEMLEATPPDRLREALRGEGYTPVAQDTARLDWLEAHVGNLFRQATDPDGRRRWGLGMDPLYPLATNLRDGIDREMETIREKDQGEKDGGRPLPWLTDVETVTSEKAAVHLAPACPHCFGTGAGYTPVGRYICWNCRGTGHTPPAADPSTTSDGV